MPGRRQFVVDHLRAQRLRDPAQYRFFGSLLQLALRTLLIVFVATTLMVEPPRSDKWVCLFVLVAYVVVVGCWCAFSLRSTAHPMVRTQKVVALLVLAADIAVVSVLSVLTGITSPQDWTSDVLRNGLFLIPLIAAAQLNPVISGAMAVPTMLALLVASAITRSANEEPWSSILLNLTVLASLAAGSVALSLIQRYRAEMIGQLARQRSRLLDDLVGLENRERQALSERVHDGALQYVLVARQDLDDVRSGFTGAVQRVESALAAASGLLRDVARELHPEVLARCGLKTAVGHLADGVASRNVAVDLDSRTWPDDERTGADHVLYGAAREILTNAIKHAHANRISIDLGQEAGLAFLRIADDGVGISNAAVERSVENGHIGLASVRAKVLACGGHFDFRPNFPGTVVAISIPLKQAADRAEIGAQAAATAGAHPG